jgi:ribosome biogenesis GTPase A
LECYPDLVKTRFQLDTLPASESELLQLIGKKRGCLRSGGQVELDKVAKILLLELRNATIGKITFETPAMMVTELAELDIIRAEKAAKKLARLTKHKHG